MQIQFLSKQNMFNDHKNHQSNYTNLALHKEKAKAETSVKVNLGFEWKS